MNPNTIAVDILEFSWRHGIEMGMQPLGLWLGLVISVCFLAMKFKCVAWEARAAWTYASISAATLLSFPTLHFGENQRSFQATGGLSFAILMVTAGLFLSIPRRSVESIFWWMRFAMVAEIICVWTKTSGLLVAPSFDLAFLALFVPFAPFWLTMPIIATILTHHGATALLVLLAMGFAWAIQNIRKRYLLPGFTISLGATILLAYVHSSAELFDGMDRLRGYSRYMSFWTATWEFMIPGIGQGSYRWISFMLDYAAGSQIFNGEMHSDWLQMLFELGIVGFTLIILAYARAIRNTWRDPRLLPAVFGAGAFCLTYHPLRMAPTLLLFGLIFKLALQKERAPYEALNSN